MITEETYTIEYVNTLREKYKNDLLLTDSTPITVTVPSPECILGDKLTAFAPRTTGIPFGVDKELEIIKQLFDVATLLEKIDNYQNLVSTYDRAVLDEIGYRDITATREDVLRDTIRSCACIIGKSQYKKLSYMRSQSLEAFACIVEALRLIE